MLLFQIPQVCTHDNYTVMIRSHSFSNPSNRCSQCQLGCCDNYNSTICTGSDRCDTMFTYCLQPFGSDTPCTTRADSGTAFDDRPIDFTQPTVLGLPNPLPLSGTSERWEVNTMHDWNTVNKAGHLAPGLINLGVASINFLGTYDIIMYHYWSKPPTIASNCSNPSIYALWWGTLQLTIHQYLSM